MVSHYYLIHSIDCFSHYNVSKYYPIAVGIHQMARESYMVRTIMVMFNNVFSRLSSGDLMYLQATTYEEKSFHITACTKGFYVSQ